MSGISSPGDKLTGDFGNSVGAILIGDRSNSFFLTNKLAPNNLGLLQQYLPEAVIGKLATCQEPSVKPQGKSLELFHAIARELIRDIGVDRLR